MIHLQILSPEKILVEAEVASVTLPGVVSPFQVLPGHAALISALEKGRVKYVAEGKEESMEISSGFVKVEDDKVYVCVER